MILDGEAFPDRDPEHGVITAPDRAARRALVGVLARAFRDNPMNVRIHGPDPDRRVRANAAGLRSLVLDHGDRLISRVITLDSRIVGGFVLVPPGEHVLPGPSLRRQIECLFLQGRAAMAAWADVTAGLSDPRSRAPRWYLAVLGVEPAWQGRRVGSALLGAIGELVERDPAPLSLECDRPESVSFYRAHGFEIRAEERVLGLPVWRLDRGVERPGPAEGADPPRPR